MYSTVQKISDSERKGSVLIFSMLVLSMMLVTGVALMAASATTQRSSLASSKSPQAFATAEKYAELVLKELRSGSTNPADKIEDLLSPSLNTTECSSSRWLHGNDADGYELQILDNGGSALLCRADIPSSGSSVTVKVIGKYQGVKRAVEVKYAFN